MKKQQSDSRLWYLALTVSLLLNAYLLLYKTKDKADQVLATVGGQSFRWKDISEPGQQKFRHLDSAYYLQLKTEAERWAENFVIPKEAEAKGVTTDVLLKAEVADKAQVSPEEVQSRYAHSPAADQIPWPETLKQVEADIRNLRFFEQKKQYLKELFERYGVRFNIPPPKSFDGKEPSPSLGFPVYEPPPVTPDVDPAKGVVGAPSRGLADAPVVIEVYSDFHCPYCKAFAGTLKELETQYAGKLRVLFHHFPLPMHAGADVTHQASVCAQEQGKFWDFHDRLWTMKDTPDKETLARLAGESGLDIASYQKCYDSGKYKSWVEEEVNRGRSRGIGSTPSSYINGRLVSGALSLDLLKGIIDWHLKPEGRYPGPVKQQGQGNQQPGCAAPGPQGPRGLDPSKKYELPADWLKKGVSKGSENAPVTVVEFLDYNCPFCQRGAALTDEILAAYPDRVRVIAKNLPLPMHPNAAKTAEAALCANEQGKFWEFRREVFGESWGKQSVEDMKAIAKKLGLDEAGFSACLDSSKMKPVIEEDVRVIQNLGGTGTPTFFVNGTPIVGAQPIENFRKVIDENLTEK